MNYSQSLSLPTKIHQRRNSPFGIVNNCGFGDIEYFDLQENIDLSSLSNEELINLTKDLRIEKSSPSNKADVRINDKYISIKSLSAAPPSIVNHTSRIGFKRYQSN